MVLRISRRGELNVHCKLKEFANNDRELINEELQKWKERTDVW